MAYGQCLSIFLALTLQTAAACWMFTKRPEHTQDTE